MTSTVFPSLSEESSTRWVEGSDPVGAPARGGSG